MGTLLLNHIKFYNNYHNTTSTISSLSYILEQNPFFNIELFISISRISDEEPTKNIPRRQHMSRQVVIASAVSSLTIVIILAVIGFFIPWKRLCCLSEAKISKPIVFISLSDDDIEVQKEKGNFQVRTISIAIFERFKMKPFT